MLGADIELHNNPLQICTAVYITLDFNGHTLSRVFGEDDNNQGTGEGHVIALYEASGQPSGPTVTINATGGTITGGNANNGGGIWIGATSMLTINGGLITDCQTSVSNEGYGGAICNNGTPFRETRQIASLRAGWSLACMCCD